MRRFHHSHRMQSSWPGIQSGIWLIGLAILFFTGLWWPGILVLVGISMVLGWVFSESTPHTIEPAVKPSFSMPAPPPAPAPAAPVLSTTARPASYHPVQALPSTCSHCGGPVRAYEVQWTGPRAAVCAYCGSGLPLKGQ